MTSNQTPNPRRHKQTLQNNRPRCRPQRLIKQRQQWHKRWRVLEIGEGVHTEEEGDGVEPGCDEANGHGAHDCDGDLAFGAVDFFCEVGGAVEAGEGVVGVY